MQGKMTCATKFWETGGAHCGCWVLCVSVCCRHSSGLTKQNFNQPEDKVKMQTLNCIFFAMILVVSDDSPLITLVVIKGKGQWEVLWFVGRWWEADLKQGSAVLFSVNHTHWVSLFFFSFFFLGLLLWHMEIPRLGVELELQPLAYTTAIAMRDPSRICDLYHNSQQLWILIHWLRPGIESATSWILVGYVNCWATKETP